MNYSLTPDQIADLAGINQICEELGADLVVIGATSLLILMGDLGRFTRDVDLTVALDLDEFERLTMRLAAIGWTPSPELEHRWIAPRRTIIDLLPAGAELRRSGSITWPVSRCKMSLAGFEHVFRGSNLPEEMAVKPRWVAADISLETESDYNVFLRHSRWIS